MTVAEDTEAIHVPAVESQDFSIADLFKDFYTVPDFQREYVWQPDKHVEKLLQDVYAEFYDETGNQSDGGDYFIGSIVACRSGDGTFQLIDGQQRMTTVYLALCAIRDCLQEQNEVPPQVLETQIKATSLEPSGDETPHYRIELQYEESGDIVERIARGEKELGDLRRATGSVRNIAAAYEAIRNFLADRFSNEPQKVRKFLAALTLRVKIVRILTPSLSRALKVFETINDRGVGLNAVDLLKNLLFMKTNAQDYPRLKEKWKVLTDTLDRCGEKPLRFLRYYVMSQHEVDMSKGLREDEIYDWFVKNAEKVGITTAPLRFVEGLVICGRAYANFINGRDAQGNPNRYLRNIGYMSGTARMHLILLLSGQHLSSDLFAELCHQVESLFFSYIITRQEPKSLERNFTAWSKELRSVADRDALRDFFVTRFQPEFARVSQDFDFAFSQLTASRIQFYRLRYVMAKLAQLIEEKAWSNVHELDHYLASAIDIEHILPQTPRDDVRRAFDKESEYDVWAQKLGNLTLLEKTINASLSNASFAEKAPGYSQSHILLTQSIVNKPTVGVNTQLNRAVANLLQFDTWDSVAIERRQRMLTDLAKEVWLREAPAAEAL